MKFLQIPILAQINSILNSTETINIRLWARIEPFSCKCAGTDKKLYNSLDAQYLEVGNSPGSSPISPFGPLSERSSRRTLIFLISTMNHCFPDYDFSNVKAEDFRKEPSYQMVINSINTTLASVISNFVSTLQAKLWSTIDAEINIKESSIYSFIPDPDSDPFVEEGTVWSFNYFFYNKRLKRVIFFTCRAINRTSVGSLHDDTDEEMEFEDYIGNEERSDDEIEMEF